MIRITPKRTALVVWLLENVDKEISALQATREARVLNYHATYNALRDLTVAGYLRMTRTGRYQVSNAPALIHQIALAFPFRAKHIFGFFLGGDMITKMRRLNSMGTEVAFTLFAASELLAPYVHTNNVHAYVRESSITSLQGRLLQSGGRRAELAEADLFLLPTSDESIFGFARDRGEFKIAPMAVLLADLESHGGLAREQADRIMKEWLSSEK